MDSLARNALRLSLAGAGAAVLGAGFIGQASAAELPAAPSAPDAPDTSMLSDHGLPGDVGENVTMDFGTPEAPSAEDTPSSEDAPSADALPGAGSLPSAGSLPAAHSFPSLDDLPPLEIPGAMNAEAPTVS